MRHRLLPPNCGPHIRVHDRASSKQPDTPRRARPSHRQTGRARWLRLRSRRRTGTPRQPKPRTGGCSRLTCHAQQSAVRHCTGRGSPAHPGHTPPSCTWSLTHAPQKKPPKKKPANHTPRTPHAPMIFTAALRAAGGGRCVGNECNCRSENFRNFPADREHIVPPLRATRKIPARHEKIRNKSAV